MNYEDLEGEFELYSAMVTIRETFQEIYEIMGIDVGGIARSITGVIDATQKIADIALKIQNEEILVSILELKKQLVEIKGSLIDAKEDNITFREQNFDLREENKSLKEQIKQLKEKPQTLTRKEKFYYKEDDERPFCPVCYDSIGRKISLLVEEDYGYSYQYKCMTCNAIHSPYSLAKG